MRSELDSISGPELVLGLVGPVGADLTLVVDPLKAELGRVAYRVIEIRVSGLISSVKAYSDYAAKNFTSDFDRIDELMDAGSTIRRETGHGDALALLTVAEIRRARMEFNRSAHPDWDEEKLTKTPLPRTAYVIRSLKNPAEVRTLKDVYGRAFFVVSAYSPRTRRVADLAQQICKSAHDSDPDRYRSKAEALISKDESEGDKFGQNVRDCFPLADVFVDLGDVNRVSTSIRRFVEILFGNAFHTPSRDEFAMFHAYATALRSSDLSRQVGAAIATGDGQLLAIGCNEVPKFGGGHYWPGDAGDARDFQSGYDSGATARIDIVSEVLQRLQETGLASEELQSMNARTAAERLTRGDNMAVLRGAQVLNVIEYGRSVHAEMAALMDAARRGVSVQGATLYCTTFPCHLCARHVISGGIKRVVYIEPYPKSAAAELFKDSMVVDPERAVDHLVAFEAFVGIAPSVYSFMFRVEDVRKNSDGTAARWEANVQCDPRFRRFVLSYLTIEDIVTGSVIPNTFKGEYEIIGASDGSH